MTQDEATSKTGQPITFDSLDGDEINAVVMDVAQDIDPSKSRRLKYTPEALLLYARVKNDFETYQKQHPNAVLDVRE